MTHGRLGRMETRRFASLMNAHGSAAYGDEWWPGRADAWMGDDGHELSRLCDRIDAGEPFDRTSAARTIVLFQRYGDAKFGSGSFGPSFDISDATRTLGAAGARRLRDLATRADAETRAEAA